MQTEKYFSWYKEYRRRERVAMYKDVAYGTGALIVIGLIGYLLNMLFFILYAKTL